MGTKINYFEDYKPDSDYCNKPQKFEDYELENLYKLNVDEIWYHYFTGSYEGSGQIILKKGDKFYQHDCSHCSCYGPTENISLNKGFDSLDELLANCSEGYKSEGLRELVDFAKQKKD